MRSDFESILSAPAVDVESKYAPYYAGIAPNQLASPAQAKKFLLEHLHPLATSKGAVMSDPVTYANAAVASAGLAKFLNVDTILADGWDENATLNLVYVFGGIPEGDLEPADSINVALAVQMYFGTKTTPPNADGLWTEVSKQIPASPINIDTRPPAPVNPASFDPPPVFGHNDDGSAKKKK